MNQISVDQVFLCIRAGAAGQCGLAGPRRRPEEELHPPNGRRLSFVAYSWTIAGRGPQARPIAVASLARPVSVTGTDGIVGHTSGGKLLLGGKSSPYCRIIWQPVCWLCDGPMLSIPVP